MSAWSPRRFGMQELVGLKPRFHIGVVDHGTHADCLVFTPDGGKDGAITHHDNVTAAREYAEKRATELGAFEVPL